MGLTEGLLEGRLDGAEVGGMDGDCVRLLLGSEEGMIV